MPPSWPIAKSIRKIGIIRQRERETKTKTETERDIVLNFSITLH